MLRSVRRCFAVAIAVARATVGCAGDDDGSPAESKLTGEDAGAKPEVKLDGWKTHPKVTSTMELVAEIDRLEQDKVLTVQRNPRCEGQMEKLTDQDGKIREVRHVTGELSVISVTTDYDLDGRVRFVKIMKGSPDAQTGDELWVFLNSSGYPDWQVTRKLGSNEWRVPNRRQSENFKPKQGYFFPNAWWDRCE